MHRSILMQELVTLKDIRIIDVREKEERLYGSIPGSECVPLSELPTAFKEFPKDETYYIVCQSGSRSYMACETLSHFGYNVVNVLGGMSAYRGRLTYEV